MTESHDRGKKVALNLSFRNGSENVFSTHPSFLANLNGTERREKNANVQAEAKAATRFSFRAQTSFILGGLEPYRALSLKRGAL